MREEEREIKEAQALHHTYVHGRGMHHKAQITQALRPLEGLTQLGPMGKKEDGAEG